MGYNISMKKYDLLVIGGGSGGVRAARLAAETGASVLLAEKGALGGTCVNVGCVPKKLFVYAASYADDMDCAPAFGWPGASVGSFDWTALRKNKDTEIARLNEVYAGLLSRAGVTVAAAEARISGAQTAQVGSDSVRAEKILIAAGAEPARPPLPGAELGSLSDDMFRLPALPRSAVVIGGGYIALEFAGILSGLGVDTSICHRAELPLRGFDEDLRVRLAAEIAKRGVKVQGGTAPVAIEKSGDELQVLLEGGRKLSAGLVLLATGRRPCTGNLGLEHADVVPGKNGVIEVDENYRTSCPWLYAIGDVISTPALTPVATAEAGAFVASAFGGGSAPVDYDSLPTAVFSRPQLATAGMSEAAAEKRGIEVKVFRSEFRAMKRGFAGKDWMTFMKLVTDAASEKVLGAHMIGEDAGEIIQGIAIAIRMGATKADFDSVIGVHPTSAEEFVSMRES